MNGFIKKIISFTAAFSLASGIASGIMPERLENSIVKRVSADVVSGDWYKWDSSTGTLTVKGSRP